MLFANSPIPLYKQLYHQLRQAIEGGEFEVGNQLPSERQLAAEYGISRLTARKALGLLQQDGYVQAYQGKGSFVARSRPETQRCTQIPGFAEMMLRQGMTPSSRMVSCGIVPVSGEIAHKLQLRDYELAIKIRRLRLANETPIALHTAYLPYPQCAPILEVDLERRSLYRSLEEFLGIKLAYAEQTTRTVLGRSGDLALLNLESPAPVVRAQRQTCDADDRVIEYLEAIYHGDRYNLHFFPQKSVETND